MVALGTSMVDIQVLNANVVNRVRKDLQDFANSLKSRGQLRKLFEEIRDEVLIPSIRTNFDVGGRPQWEPIAPSTAGFGAGIGRAGEAFVALSETSGIVGGRRPLNKTGQMKRAATSKARFSIRDNVMMYGDWPEKRWFGPVHNLEDLSEKADIPNRPFTILQPEDGTAIMEITGDWVEDRVNQHVRRRYV